MSDPGRQGKRPVTGLAGTYGHPLHPVLVTVPIGAWVASFVFDVASHATDEAGTLADGSTWLIGMGVLGALAAAMIGLLDLAAVPTRTRAFRTGVLHAALNTAAVISYVGSFLIRQGRYGDGEPVPIALIALSALALAIVAAAGFLGGKLAFTYGVRVADERTQARGFVRSPHR